MGAPFGEGELGHRLTQCGLPVCQVSSWSVQPFGHSARTLQADRQDSTDRQRSDSVGRNVLQTVAQIVNYQLYFVFVLNVVLEIWAASPSYNCTRLISTARLQCACVMTGALLCCFHCALLVGGAVRLSSVGVRRRRSGTLGLAACRHCSRRRQRPFASLWRRPLHCHRPRGLPAWRPIPAGNLHLACYVAACIFRTIHKQLVVKIF